MPDRAEEARMVKLPDLSKGKALLAAVATIATPKLMELLQDPARAEQARQLVERLAKSAQPRTPDARLAAKVAAARDHVDALEPGDVGYAQRDALRTQLSGLEKKRSLVMGAYTGRERSRQLRGISKQVDDVLARLLQAADGTSPPA